MAKPKAVEFPQKLQDAIDQIAKERGYAWGLVNHEAIDTVKAVNHAQTTYKCFSKLIGTFYVVAYSGNNGGYEVFLPSGVSTHQECAALLLPEPKAEKVTS